MKNKLFIINLTSYILISSIILDAIMYNFKENISICGQFIYFIKYNLQFDISDLKPILLALFINIILSVFFYYVLNKLKLITKIYSIIIFIIIHIIIFIFLHFFDIRLGLNSIYLLFYLIPLLIISIIAYPLNWINKKIIEK